MQTVTSVPVPLFQVPALTTGATSIVSRTKTRIPVNNPGIYSHVASTTNYTARVSFGNNESGFVPGNTFLEMDITPTWFDGISAARLSSNASPALCPSFDQSIQSLIARLKISTPQGLVIDEVQAYNVFSNIVEMHLVDRQKKDMDIPRFSTYSKDVYKERGMGIFVDAWRDKCASPASLQHGVTRRIQIPLLHSTVMNRMKFIPSFVIRNGIEFEVDFERPERAFVYESAAPPSRSRLRHIPCAIANVNESLSGPSTALEYNWIIGPGSHTSTGVPTTNTIAFTQDNAGNITAGGVVPPNGNTVRAVISNYSYPPNWPTIAPFFINSTISPPANTTQIFWKCKNFLYLNNASTNLLISTINNRQASPYNQSISYGFPITIFRDGLVIWRGFTLMDAVGATFTYVSTTLNAGAVPGPYVPLSGVRVYNRKGKQNSFVNGRFKFPGSETQTINSSSNLANFNTVDEQLATSGTNMNAFPLYNWDHVDNFNDCIPAFNFQDNYQGVSGEQNIYTDMANDKNTICIDIDNMFTLNGDLTPNVVSTVTHTSGISNLAEPRIMHLQHLITTGRGLINWNYTVNNISLIVDWLKPSSDIFVQFSKSFQMPTGIPYALTRILHYQRDFDAQSTGQQQLVVPFQVRSLTSLVIVLSDPYFSNFGASMTKYYLPMLSSFQRRGLTRVEVTIGGARKPEYTLQFDKNGGFEHFPETTNAFGMSNASGFDQSFSRESINETRNYLVAGNYELPSATTAGYWAGRQYPNSSGAPHLLTPRSRGLDYIDSSKFVIAIPLAKLDTNGFASGLDTTMSGNLNVTLYFSQDAAPTLSNTTFDSGYDLKRPIRVDVWGTIDAVLTLQNDANSIRN